MLPTVVAYAERRVEALFVPRTKTLEFIASAMVQPRHRVIRPVEDFLGCFVIEEVQTTANDALLTGSGISARLRILDDCPETQHACTVDRDQRGWSLLEVLESHLGQ